MGLPEHVVTGDARLCLARAWTSFAKGALDEVLPCLENAEAAPVPGPLLDGTSSVASGAATLRASYWLRMGDFGKTVSYAREALALEHGPWRAISANCLACGIAAAVSKRLSYCNIHTTKLLRRGIDIERPRTTSVLQRLTVADVMQPIPQPEGHPPLLRSQEPQTERDAIRDELWARVAGPVTDTRQTQELFGDETLEQALRQLTVSDHDGLPVVSHDRQHLTGWITRADVLQTLANSASSSAAEIEHGASHLGPS